MKLGAILVSFMILCVLVSSGFSLGGTFSMVTREKSSPIQSDYYFYNLIKIDDPIGDATEGAPSYVDIKSLTIMQIGQYVQFIWEGSGNLFNNANQYYFIVLDADFDPHTGQYWGGSGGELKITIYHDASLVYFDEKGNVIHEVHKIPVIFQNNSFYLNIEREKITADSFNLYFESSGGTPFRDQGSLNLINLQPSREEIKIVIDSDNSVLDENPPLINIPHKDTTVQLRTYILQNGNKTQLPTEEINYNVYHPVKDPRLGEPSSIISVDENGTARYLREGYVFVTSYSKEYHLISEPTIIATGKVYGNPETDNVIAVFPEDYRPDGSRYSFGDMMTNYPNYIKTVNTAYNLMSDMYVGYKPFDGDKQIFTLLVMEGHCGGNNNPLETAPGCYMNLDNGEPQYNVVIHEMGHNFAATTGMQRLTFADGAKIGRAGFGEGVASLPVIYFAKDLYEHPEKYGFTNSSFEWQYYRRFLQDRISYYKGVPLKGDISYSHYVLNDFEEMIRRGKIKGIFDNDGEFDGVAVFCSLFQQYAYEFTNDTNPHKQEVIRRFLNLFPNIEPLSFEEDKVETYFSAAFSAAVGYDMKEKLKFWGFSIDEAYYSEVYPILIQTLTGTSTLKILITSPENKTYATNGVPLTFTVDKIVSWMAYSLDGQANVTIAEDTNIVGLSEGAHTITVYANDTTGNMGYSTVYFTIDTVPPNIEILSPQNTTYKDSSVSLSCVVDEAISWIGYSLDGQANVTISENTTLSGLSYGLHSIVLYATDAAGNTGASETIHFSIETSRTHIRPESTLTLLVFLILVVVLTIIAAVTLAVVRKKRLPSN